MRARGRSRLDIVLVVNKRAEAMKEEIAVGLRQAQNLERLRQVAAETGHALGAYYSLAAGVVKNGRHGKARGKEVATYIHSKVNIVDDRFISIGSANLTNRSLDLDTELNATWEAEARGSRQHCNGPSGATRVSLLAEQHRCHPGRPPRALARQERPGRPSGWFGPRRGTAGCGFCPRPAPGRPRRCR